MYKAVFILLMIIFPFWGHSQLPGNFNLIANGTGELTNAGGEFLQDTLPKPSNGCWFRANKMPAYVDILPGRAYLDVTSGRIVEDRSKEPVYCIQVSKSFGSYIQSKNLFLDSASVPSRQYAQTRLLEPLKPGVSYKFSVKAYGLQAPAFWAIIGRFGNKLSNLGVYFSINKLADFTNTDRINVIPQIRFIGWTFHKVDTFDFVELSGIYTSSGGEEYITLGNFDYWKDFHFAALNDNDGTIDTVIRQNSYNYYADFSLVSDTTLPIISLNRFSLGKDTSLACLGDSITLGGEDHFFHYWWNTGDTSRFITIKTPGNYWCRVDFGCSTYTDTIVVKPLAFSFSLGKDTNINCTGSTMRLKAPDGYSYVWSTGATTAYADITSPGKYWCRLDYGCGTYTDTILVNPNPFTFSLGTDTSIKCFADSIRIFASPAYSNLWSTGETSNSILVTTPGTYWCRSDDGCTTFTDTIIVNPILESFSLGKDTTICADIPLLLNAPSGKTILWNTGASTNTIEITTPGTYWCRIDFGCNTVTDTIVVIGSVAPPSFNIEDTALCEAQLPVSISAPYTAAAYLWSNDSTAFGTNFNSIGQQWLRISNVCGDKHYTDTFTIQSLNVALNNINLGNDTSNCLYGFFLDTITLQVPANNSTQIKWSTGSADNFIKVQEPGVYWVQVSNVCFSVSDTINITGCGARDVPKVDIPNAFTPNGDGKNDVFRLKYLPQQVVSFNLKIYNRYGQMVSELKSRNDEWDGGEYELGVYYYLFVYKDITGKEYTQKGDISLVR